MWPYHGPSILSVVWAAAHFWERLEGESNGLLWGVTGSSMGLPCEGVVFGDTAQHISTTPAMQPGALSNGFLSTWASCHESRRVQACLFSSSSPLLQPTPHSRKRSSQQWRSDYKPKTCRLTLEELFSQFLGFTCFYLSSSTSLTLINSLYKASTAPVSRQLLHPHLLTLSSPFTPLWVERTLIQGVIVGQQII